MKSACYMDCPHDVGECLGAQRVQWRANFIRYRNNSNQRQIIEARREKELAERQARAEQKKLRSAVISISRFLRWGNRRPKYLQ